MNTGQRLEPGQGLMAGNSLGCLFMPSYSHRFPSLATHSPGLAKLVSKRLDIESLSFSSAVMCDQSFLSSAKSRDLFGKWVQGNPLPEREVSSHLLLFPKKLW